MKRIAVLAGIWALLVSAPAAAQIKPLTDDELALFRQGSSYHTYPQQPLVAWEAELRQALARREDIGVAADRLAPRYGLSGPRMRELVRLWLTISVRQYTELPRDLPRKAELRQRLLALLSEAREAPLVLQAVADGLDAMEPCSEADMRAMLAGSSDPAADAWTIAETATCGDNYLRAAAAAPDRAMAALIRLAYYGTLQPRDALPLYQWLTTPAALMRIDEAGRPALTAWLVANRAKLLFGTGLADQAVALLEGLPPALRQRVLSQPAGAFTALVDGRQIRINVERADQSLLVALAGAYAAAGRNADAASLLASATQLPAARHALDCAARRTDRAAAGECRRIPYEDGIERTIDLLLIEHLLQHPDDDPYPLAEAAFSSIGGGDGTMTAELRCRVFAEPSYREICEGPRAQRLDQARLEPRANERAQDARQSAALAALPLPGFGEMRAAVAADFRRLRASAGPLPAEPDYAHRDVRPAPAPFVEQPLPASARGARPAPVQPPPGTGALPEGFLPVRFERAGDRAVAISLSQTYDPTGEVSQGGYWVHLSHDGGRSWQAPLYTGLAENFPYVVPASSRLPLLRADRLDLEVEVEELDTASITYPPVALRTRRRAAGLYLAMPLATLSRDSDGDGITDIAAARLLLDRARHDGGTPFVVGSDRGAGCGAAPAERAALIALLERLFSGRSGAIVEPVDRPAADPLSIGAWRGAAAATDRPVFIKGDPADYRCLRPNRLMIVYGDADIEALGRFRPDFHAVEVPRIVYNRAHDRGYVRWSMGWTGGTLGLRLVAGRWVFEEMSSWIT